MVRKKLFIGVFLFLAMPGLVHAATATTVLTPKQKLGQFLYMDKSLSSPVGQACVTCHHPSAGFADPDNRKDPVNSVVSVGADGFSVGGRNAPTAAYAAHSPVFQWDAKRGMYIGGQFWDGRAPTLKEQAKGPFLNPVEMANTMEGVVAAVRQAPYAWLFFQVYGPTSLDDVPVAYDKIAEAIADFEGTGILNKFTSKYDYYLAGKVRLSKKELRGFQLFNDPLKGNCAACHPSTRGPYDPRHPLFTDYSFDNLGIPKSTNPLIANNPVDYGLGLRAAIAAVDPCTLPDGAVVSCSQAGKYKVPALRNIAKTPPYAHNGYFATLTEIVNFYNTADIAGMWSDPEVPLNVNRTELGNLGLTAAEVEDIVAFLHTLSDGYPLP